MTSRARTRSSCRRPTRCRCALATTVSSRISPPPRRAASAQPYCICRESRWISTTPPISGILRSSDRAHGRACGSRATCRSSPPPRPAEPGYLDKEQVLAIAEAGAKAGGKEALFTLGDKPELRYGAAREGLARLGHDTTLSYLAEMAALVLKETGLLPHLNPGLMTRDEIDVLRAVSVSQGIMLETASERLAQRGGPHFGSPDKAPSRRLDCIAMAGEAAVPFTSGILIGIGETRRERIEAMLALRGLHERHGHIQEVIVQNFRAKPGTRMAEAPEPPVEELLWTAAAARLVLGAEMSIQAPPNLSYDEFPRLLE